MEQDKYFENPYPAVLTYPWPHECNDYVAETEKDVDDWLRNDYSTFLSEKMIQKYYRNALHLTTARMLPGAISYAHARVCCRQMVWTTIFDDYYGPATVTEMDAARKRVVAILKGADPEPGALAMDIEMLRMREEYKAIAPVEWLVRFTNNMDRYLKYGMMGEAPYKTTGQYPKSGSYLLLREYAVSVPIFALWPEIGLNSFLSSDLAAHPIIQRFQSLTSRIIGLQNDVYSVAKELANGKQETINLVLILQHEQKISLEEAVKEVVRIHDADVAEFVALQEGLPHFGPDHERIHKQVYEHARYLGKMIAGLNHWYFTDTVRYHSMTLNAESEYVKPLTV
ncbi:terpene synthase family protein [Parapedobacter tibetensis]|uniref:terpene synthase family protein n=1 Tax=Parapedobacter tibetensis TaxID=2972951 RepID=UPI00214D9224|nr:terpene synthase family protein [Parapedobacter tibetensis]